MAIVYLILLALLILTVYEIQKESQSDEEAIRQWHIDRMKESIRREDAE